MHGITDCIKMLFFSHVTGPELLLSQVYRLVDSGLFEVSTDIQLLLQLSQITYWLLVRMLLHAAPNLGG